MINNSSINKWERLKQKQVDTRFINRLQAGMNCSMFEAKAILNCVCDTCQPFFDSNPARYALRLFPWKIHRRKSFGTVK